MKLIANAFAVAIIVFLLVGVGVTEILLDKIWPSLFVGIPAGIIAGIVAYNIMSRKKK